MQGDLQVPLLVPYEPEDEAALTCSSAGDGKESDDENAAARDDECSDNSSAHTCSGMLISLLLIALLLWVQFKIVFLHPNVETGEWSTVRLTIGLYVVACYLYKRSCSENNKGSLYILMPELIMDVVLLLASLKKFDAAVSLMMIFTSAFSLTAALNTMFSCSTTVGEELEDEDESTASPVSYCDKLFNFLMIPLLLWIQFKMAFADPTVKTGDWNTVQQTIGLFAVTCYLYRSSCDEKKNSILILMPELVMDTILLLVLLKQVQAAVSFMMVFTIAFSLTSALQSSVCILPVETKHDHQKEAAMDYGLDKTQHDIRWNKTSAVQPVTCIAGVPVAYTAVV